MATINLNNEVLEVTLGDIVQTFTEKDLERQMPIVMEDIDADSKEAVDTYQSYLASGNFSEAESYRAEHPELETRIWDAYKANAMLAYAAYVYIYARDQNQQCLVSDTQPADDAQVEGDIWYKIINTSGNVITCTQYVKQYDGSYSEMNITTNQNYTSFTIPASGWSSSSGMYRYTVTASGVSSGDRYHWWLEPSNGTYITDSDTEIDFMLKGMECLSGQLRFYASSNISSAITITVEGLPL